MFQQLRLFLLSLCLTKGQLVSVELEKLASQLNIADRIQNFEHPSWSTVLWRQTAAPPTRALRRPALQPRRPRCAEPALRAERWQLGEFLVCMWNSDNQLNCRKNRRVYKFCLALLQLVLSVWLEWRLAGRGGCGGLATLT